MSKVLRHETTLHLWDIKPDDVNVTWRGTHFSVEITAEESTLRLPLGQKEAEALVFALSEAIAEQWMAEHGGKAWA